MRLVHKRSEVRGHNCDVILPDIRDIAYTEEFRKDDTKTFDKYCFNVYEINTEGCDIMTTLHKADPNKKIMNNIIERAAYIYKDINDDIHPVLTVEVMQILYQICKEALIWEYSKDCKTRILKVYILNSCCISPNCPIYKYQKVLFDAIRLYSVLSIQ